MTRYALRNRRAFASVLFAAMLITGGGAARAQEVGGQEGGNESGGEGPEGGSQGGGQVPPGGNQSGGDGLEGGIDGGGNEGGGEGPEGGSSGGGGSVAFVSSGLTLGVFESVPLAPNETFAGLLGDTEIAIRFDKVNEKFIGRIRHEGVDPVCDVKVAVMLSDPRFAPFFRGRRGSPNRSRFGGEGGFGGEGHSSGDGDVSQQLTVNQTLSGNPLRIDGLLTGGRRDFEFPLPRTTYAFSGWTTTIETFSCDSAPAVVVSPTGPGCMTGGGEGGSGTEGGAEGPEGGTPTPGVPGAGDESSPPIPLSDGFSGVFQNQNFAFAYDPSTRAFRGTVVNPTSNFVCLSRTEIHLGVAGQVVELGPTIPENLGPGEVLNVVVTAHGVTPLTYTLHPEASPCP